MDEATHQTVWVTPYGGAFVIPAELLGASVVRADGMPDGRATKANKAFREWIAERAQEDLENISNG